MSESENNPVKQGAFPTFRAIPAGLLKAPRGLGRCWKKSGHYVLAILVVIAIAYTALDIYATKQLNHQLNLIQEKGEPLTLAEAAPPEVPDEQNAAILYSRAIKQLKLPTKREFLPVGMSQKERNAVLAQNVAALSLIRQATAKPQCRFELDWNSPSFLTLLLPEAGTMRTLSRLLALQARHEAETGNTVAAMQDVHRLYIMAQHLSDDPFLISAISSTSMEKEADTTLAKVLLNVSLSPTQARDFEKSLPVINWDAVRHRALLTERIATLEIFNSAPGVIVDMDGPSFSHSLFLFLWRIKPLHKLDETYALKLWQDAIISNDISGQNINQAPWYAETTKILMPIFPGTLPFDLTEVQRREREIALALAAYHSQYHEYPATLQEAELFWKNTFPLDPYSKKSFCYKRTGKTFLLYSVGMDGKDNDGKWRESSGSVITTDIVWGH